MPCTSTYGPTTWRARVRRGTVVPVRGEVVVEADAARAQVHLEGHRPAAGARPLPPLQPQRVAGHRARLQHDPQPDRELAGRLEQLHEGRCQAAHVALGEGSSLGDRGRVAAQRAAPDLVDRRERPLDRLADHRRRVRCGGARSSGLPPAGARPGHGDVVLDPTAGVRRHLLLGEPSRAVALVPSDLLDHGPRGSGDARRGSGRAGAATSPGPGRSAPRSPAGSAAPTGPPRPSRCSSGSRPGTARRRPGPPPSAPPGPAAGPSRSARPVGGHVGCRAGHHGVHVPELAQVAHPHLVEPVARQPGQRRR